MGTTQSILNKASSMTKQLPEMYQSKQLNAELASVHPANEEEYDDGYDSDISEDELEEEDPEWNERLLILQDASKLSRLADFFLNPHKPVVTSDPYACGRNYFSRPSAYQPEELMEEERALIMEEMKQLKQLAMDYLHPERPVVTTDPCACGRNYFTRPSAPTTVPMEQAEEEARILEDVAQLKRLATDYMHPERPVVTTDPYACGRNYFTRPSANQYYDGAEDMKERNQILKDARLLKQLAVDYMHPERPVFTTDPYACGRNYFTRPSAYQYENEENMEERNQILKEATQLKRLAVDYMHPERPVVTTDPYACGRNYFARSSAYQYEDDEVAAERERILKEASQLKQLAVDYLHPERPVVTTDPFACGRNYFSRPSAHQYEDEEDMEERNQILKEASQLKQLAVDYLHPERPVVTTDPYASGRNFFNRPSAYQCEDEEFEAERELVLKEATQLKRLAVDYMHPERPVVTTDPFACGRNYFSRPAACEYEDLKEERDLILAEARQLRKLAVDYLHPERPVVTTDPYACGRNYFSRPSAARYEDDFELERELIMDDTQHLKELAHEYLCREVQAASTVPMADKVTTPSTPILAEAADPACVLFVGMNY